MITSILFRFLSQLWEVGLIVRILIPVIILAILIVELGIHEFNWFSFGLITIMTIEKAVILHYVYVSDREVSIKETIILIIAEAILLIANAIVVLLLSDNPLDSVLDTLFIIIVSQITGIILYFIILYFMTLVAVIVTAIVLILILAIAKLT